MKRYIGENVSVATYLKKRPKIVSTDVLIFFLFSSPSILRPPFTVPIPFIFCQTRTQILWSGISYQVEFVPACTPPLITIASACPLLTLSRLDNLKVSEVPSCQKHPSNKSITADYNCGEHNTL